MSLLDGRLVNQGSVLFGCWASFNKHCSCLDANSCGHVCLANVVNDLGLCQRHLDELRENTP